MSSNSTKSTMRRHPTTISSAPGHLGRSPIPASLAVLTLAVVVAGCALSARAQEESPTPTPTSTATHTPTSSPPSSTPTETPTPTLTPTAAPTAPAAIVDDKPVQPGIGAELLLLIALGIAALGGGLYFFLRGGSRARGPASTSPVVTGTRPIERGGAPAVGYNLEKASEIVKSVRPMTFDVGKPEAIFEHIAPVRLGPIPTDASARLAYLWTLYNAAKGGEKYVPVERLARHLQGLGVKVSTQQVETLVRELQARYPKNIVLERIRGEEGFHIALND